MIRVSTICFAAVVALVQLAGSTFACPPSGGGYYSRPKISYGYQPTYSGYGRFQSPVNRSPAFGGQGGGFVPNGGTQFQGGAQFQGGTQLQGGAQFQGGNQLQGGNQVQGGAPVNPNGVAPNGVNTPAPVAPAQGGAVNPAVNPGPNGAPNAAPPAPAGLPAAPNGTAGAAPAPLPAPGANGTLPPPPATAGSPAASSGLLLGGS